MRELAPIANPVQAVKVTCAKGERMPRMMKMETIWSE